MADIESNVKVNIDTTDALSQLKLLQQQISAFQQAMRKAGADNALAARQMQQNLANSINATGKFQANIQTIQTSSERFTSALEKNKLSMGEYFRYAGGASKTFGKLFRTEFETINQVARERVKDLQTQYIKLGRDANGAMKAIAVRPLALDMDNLGTKTQIAAQRQQLFNQLMKQGSTNLLNFGKNTQWAGRQLMVGFTVPLTMMGSAAAKAYMEIEKASISFKRVYGDINTTANETEKMVNSVRQLANEFTKYGVAVSDTMDMAAKAAAMGKTGADLLAQISQANKLAVLGNVEQNQALETTISLTNAFGTSADQLSEKIDFLNAVENQTVTSIEDLTIAIPKAAPVIKQLGGNVEDLTFFLTAMKEGGINASEGANALKSGIASMINPTKKASDFLAGFGINIKSIVEGDAGNIKKTVIDVAKAFDTLDPLNRARAIEQMFGKFQFSRISTLFQNVIKEGSQANQVAGLANQTAEELAVLSEREMKKISDSPMYKFQKSVQDIQAKLAPVGEAFLKAITPIVDFVGKILDGFNSLGEGSKQFITVLVTAVAGIGPLLLMTFGLLANGIANIMKLFTNLKGFFNKTTRPSDILGEQTSYMTTEQLKGAAIAASLDQAHAKLIQTFTSEKSAVDGLTTAYRNAVQAQQAFAGVPGVPVGNPNAVPPKKYANGVSMVPGPAGAGDIVPALLSPGEAVIPAKHAQKYAPVIAGMVSGNLPGFENGTTGVGMPQGYAYGTPYVSEAQKARQEKLAAEKAARDATPEGQARIAAAKEEFKKRSPHVFLYDPKLAGPLTEDSPVTKRIIEDQNRGRVMFVSEKNSIAFTSSPEYRMLRGLGLSASSSKWGVIPPWKAKSLGDLNNVNVYGSKGGIIRRYASGGIVPGYNEGTEGVGMRQSIYGPMTLKQTEGLQRTGIQLKEISDEVMAGPYANVPPTDFGTQITPTSGHSFPAFEVGGIYQKPDGTKVFVKPQIDLVGAMAEVRGTTIARDAHGLVAPKQEIRVMMDPTDPEHKRRFLVLESAVDERIANIPNKFSDNEYFTQLVASLLRGDKDLGVGNLGGNILADVGPAGVFGRASGKRALGSAVNSMEEQAIINLLGVKGGAKRFFAEATSEQISNMSPAAYDAAMKAEIQRVMPKLQATIAGFGNMSPEEQAAYQAMQQRLQAGMSVDWSKYQVMHSAVKPKEYSDGVVSAGLASPKNPGAFAQALQAMGVEQIRKELRVQDTHLVAPLDIKDPKYLAQVQRVFPGATPEELAAFEPVSNLTAQLPGNANQVMKGKSGYPGSFFKTVWDGLENKLSKSAQIAGISLNESQTVENEIGNVIGNYPRPINDATVSDIVGEVLGSTAKVTDDAMMKRKLWQQAITVGGLRSKPKKMEGMLGTESNRINDIAIKMLQDGALDWNKNRTGLVLKLASGAEGPRFASWNMDPFGSSKGDEVELELRRRAQDAAYGPNGWAFQNNWNSPPPQAAKELSLPSNWNTLSPAEKSKIAKTLQGKNFIDIPFRKQDVEGGSFTSGKLPSQQAYDSSRLKGSPLNWSKNQSQVLDAYNAMSQPFGNFDSIIPKTGYKFFNDLALKMEKGGVVPGGTGKPKASVFDIDDTLLDLASFMPAHQEANAKLPKEDRKKWYEEVAKNPKGIPAAIERLKAAQARGNKVLLMTARPEAYEPHTLETLRKLGIDMNGVKLISRRDKDYRKPEQMKYDKTSKFMKYYDIEEFYDDMPATRGAISLLGIPAYNPLKLADGVFSVPGPKGAGDVVPAMLSPGEAVIPADKAAQHRGMISQMISGNVPGYANGFDPYAGSGGMQFGFGNPLPVIIMQDRTKDSGSEPGGTPEDAPKKRGRPKKEPPVPELSRMDKIRAGVSKAFTRNEMTGRVQGAMYGLSAAAGVASTIPGGIGQAAQQALPAIGAMTSAMMMIPGPAGIFAGGLIAAGTVVMQVQAHLAELRDEAVKTTKAMGAGNDAIKKFAEFSKKVSGTEAMNKQRQNSAGQFFNVVEGKTTYGESYMKSDAGKQLVTDVSKSIASGGLGDAEAKITNQLSAAVASGVMTPEQGRSVAASLGQALGNSQFGIDVAGNLTNLVGLNGEDILKNGLSVNVRAKIIADSMDNFNKTANAGVNPKVNGMTDEGNTAVSTYGGVAIGGLVGGAAAAAASAGLLGATMGSVLPGIGTGIGLAVGAITGFTVGLVQAEEQASKLGGAMSESMQNTLQVQQQMVDSLDVSYQKRIANAQAAGDEAEAIRLQNQYLEDQKILMGQNSDNIQQMYDQVGKADTGFLGGMFGTGLKNKLSDASNKAIEDAYKGSGQEVAATITKEAIDNAGGTKDQQIMLKSFVGSKQLGLGQAQQAVSLFGGSNEGMNTLQSLMKSGGPVEVNRLLGVTSGLDAKTQKSFLTRMATGVNPETGKRYTGQDMQQQASALETVQKTTGVFDKKTGTSMIKYMLDPKNQKELLKFQKDVEKLKKNKNIDIKVATAFVGKDIAKHLKDKDFQKYFGKAKNSVTKATFMTEYKEIMLQESNGDVKAAFETWKAENGNKNKSFADYAAFQADRTVSQSGQDNTAVKKVNTGGTGGPAASWLDQYVNAIRDVSNQSQGLTTGIKASGAALAKFGQQKNKFGGLIYDLKKAGASNDIIKAAMGGDEATTNALIDKKTGQLKKGAAKILKGVKEAIAAAKIGDWLTSGAEGQNQSRIEAYNAGLDVIKNKEDAINKSYDERQAALEEIGKIQEKNNQQQQDTMTLADALSKGDIAAAAKAALQAKQNDQAAALTNAKDSVENERKKELAAIVVQMGNATFTRAQLEEKIAKYSKESAQAKADELYTQLKINEAAGSDKFPTVARKARGGLIAGYAMGGMVYANNGLSVEASKYALGTDTIPAMLTPGEFVMSKPAVDRIGTAALSSMNNGTSVGESVYNYSITVNANSSDSSGIADAVLREIKRIDSQRIRSSAI